MIPLWLPQSQNHSQRRVKNKLVSFVTACQGGIHRKWEGGVASPYTALGIFLTERALAGAAQVAGVRSVDPIKE